MIDTLLDTESLIIHLSCSLRAEAGDGGGWAWNNGKEVPRLDLTSSTTPGQQIHYGRPHPDSKYNKSV